jgi:hypothetical protein
MTYDSKQDSITHISLVRHKIIEVIANLTARGQLHDYSKIEEPEKSMYDEYIPNLREPEKEFGYGSPQYEQAVRQMSEVMHHHFAANSHHPEHYPNGINGMSLLDLIEALADWKAASQKSGQPLNIEANKRRFGISDQLAEILQNTVREMDW